jgi:hypothetical protein
VCAAYYPKLAVAAAYASVTCCCSWGEGLTERTNSCLGVWREGLRGLGWWLRITQSPQAFPIWHLMCRLRADAQLLI